MTLIFVYPLFCDKWYTTYIKLERTVYMLNLCFDAEYLFKLGTRARTFLLVLVWHTFVLQPLGLVRARVKVSCIQIQSICLNDLI